MDFRDLWCWEIGGWLAGLNLVYYLRQYGVGYKNDEPMFLFNFKQRHV
jgi:hypothetical protein